MTNKQAQENLRKRYLEVIRKALLEIGEEVLQTGSNALAIPCVDDNGDDQYCCFTIKVPSGSRDGEAYDAYGLAQEYEMKCKEKAEKAKIAAEEKARKIARDAELRRQKAEAKARAAAERKGE